jgi:hypothetical protein
MAAHDATRHEQGEMVEVWNRSLGRFAGQFEVTDRTPSGVRVRRRSDASVLPETFTPDEIRSAPQQSPML